MLSECVRLGTKPRRPGCFPRMPALAHDKARPQGSKVSNLQVFKASRCQSFKTKLARFQKFKASRCQGFEVSKFQVFNVSLPARLEGFEIAMLELCKRQGL